MLGKNFNTSDITSLVFDFGGVLFPTEPYSGGETSPDDRKKITGAVKSIYKDFGADISRSAFSVPQFRQEFTNRVAGLSPTRINIVLQSICEPDIDVIEFLQTAHAKYSLYGLVNAPLGWTEIRRGLHHLDEFFQRIVVSHEINVRKPDPKIFEYFVESTKCAPSTTVFIDDKEQNCVVARQLGFQILHFTKPDNLFGLLK